MLVKLVWLLRLMRRLLLLLLLLKLRLRLGLMELVRLIDLGRLERWLLM